MAKLSVSIVIGERIASTHFIDVDEKRFKGIEKQDIEAALRQMAQYLEQAGRERQKKAGK